MTWYSNAFFYFFIASPLLIPMFIFAPLYALIVIIVGAIILKNIRWITRTLESMGHIVLAGIARMFHLV
jgi:hypothetical protein